MPSSAPASWFVYLLECQDGSLYTGITTDVARRYAQHAAGTGARYTRARPPRQLVAHFQCEGRAVASRAEHAIKQLTTAAKWRLVADPSRVSELGLPVEPVDAVAIAPAQAP